MTIMHIDQLTINEAQMENEKYIGGSNNIIAVITAQAISGCHGPSPMSHNKVRVKSKGCIHNNLHKGQ